MGRFTKVLKEKGKKEKLSKHPLKNESDDIKKDYIQALVLLANEDDNFSSEEKEHIEFLLDLVGLDKNLIDEFDKFAKEAGEDEFFDFIERLKKLDEKIKMQIMVESCVVAFKDDNLDEAEENIIDEYLDILGLQDKKNEIMFVAKALSYKDIDNAILTYLVYKDLYTQFEYMFDILEIDAKKELKELYSFEWTNWQMIYGSIDGDVSTKCVSTRQMAVMLNSMLLSGVIKQEESKIISFDIVQKENTDEKATHVKAMANNLRFNNIDFIHEKATHVKEMLLNMDVNDLQIDNEKATHVEAMLGFNNSSCKVINNIEDTNLTFDKLFKYEEEAIFKGANSTNVELFFNFTDKLYDEKIIDTKYSIVIANGDSSDDFRINENSLYLPEENIFEICKDKQENYKLYDKEKHIDKHSKLGDAYCFARFSVFRAMKIEQEEK